MIYISNIGFIKIRDQRKFFYHYWGKKIFSHGCCLSEQVQSCILFVAPAVGSIHLQAPAVFEKVVLRKFDNSIIMTFVTYTQYQKNQFVCLFALWFYIQLENLSFMWSPIFGTDGHRAVNIPQRATPTICDMGHPFIMAIPEDTRHSHLFASGWQWSCHYMF